MRFWIAMVVFLSLIAPITWLASQTPPLPPALNAALAAGHADFWVLLSPPDTTPPPMTGNIAQIRRQLVTRWQAHAAAEQAPLVHMVERAGAEAHSFWLVNALLVRNGTRDLALALARQPHVVGLALESAHAMPLPQPAEAPTRVNGTVEWHVSRVGAPDVWANGITGEGVVIGVQDTGIEATHPALATRERVVSGTQPHDYAWHDAIHSDMSGNGSNPCGFDSPIPCDDHGHGTHVAGIAVGGTATDSIGIAPGATWIACRNMEEGVGSPATYLECFQWLLAPTKVDGSEPRPDLAADIINNSWACPPYEGCNSTNTLLLRRAVAALQAAGVLVVASAGNEGPACDSTSMPPGMFIETLSVASSTSSNTLSSFSSRGPGEGNTKPNITAPGSNVRSAFVGGGYAILSGTSMAAPNVAGVGALVWSGAPQVKNKVALTHHILQSTATPFLDTSCGGDDDAHPNNAWGWGLVNAPAAVARAQTCAQYDWDGDGATTGAEIAMVQAHLGEPVGPETSALDLDGDGMIDADDETLLMGYWGDACDGLVVITHAITTTATLTNTTPFTLTVQATFLQGTQFAHTGFTLSLAPFASHTLASPTPVADQVRLTVLWMGDEDLPLRIASDTAPPKRLFLPLVHTD